MSMDIITKNLNPALKVDSIIQYLNSTTKRNKDLVLGSFNKRTKGKPFEIIDLKYTPSTPASSPQLTIDINYKDGSGKEAWILLLE